LQYLFSFVPHSLYSSIFSLPFSISFFMISSIFSLYIWSLTIHEFFLNSLWNNFSKLLAKTCSISWSIFLIFLFLHGVENKNWNNQIG
jgi:hypothetical protein